MDQPALCGERTGTADTVPVVSGADLDHWCQQSGECLRRSSKLFEKKGDVVSEMWDDDDEDYEADPDFPLPCMSCDGEGLLDPEDVREFGEQYWFVRVPVRCPNCRGSGLRKDQTMF